MNGLWETTWTKVHIESKMHEVLINFQNSIILTIFNFFKSNYGVLYLQYLWMYQYTKFENNLMNGLWETAWTKVHIESKMPKINFQNSMIWPFLPFKSTLHIFKLCRITILNLKRSFEIQTGQNCRQTRQTDTLIPLSLRYTS